MNPSTSRANRYQPVTHYVALLAALFTLPLLFVGGSVTTYGVGMAVPDWPSTFGINMFIYNFWNAPFGVQVEHTHRLYGAAVGLATMVVMGWLLAFDSRRYMKVLGVVALVVVITQGILGGTRVTQVSTFLAAVHGCLGQAFFGLMVAIAVLTGRRWVEAGTSQADATGLRLASATMLVLVYAQVVVGAWFRHFRTLEALTTHGLIAAVVLGFGSWLAWRILSRPADNVLKPSARALLGVVILQVGLGILALLMMLPLGGNPRPPTFWQAVLRTFHQTNGALLVATSIVLILRVFRHLGLVRDG
jgi:cytochrome c oxidase assembly protein subunit 15